MVTLKKLKLTNFLSYKDAEINFKEDTKLNIIGVSGSGKSSIVEAVIWTLYGKGRVENRNIIKRGAKFATVVLTVVDDKQEYRIERSVTLTGKHTLEIGEKKTKVFVPLKLVGLRDAQGWIEKQLLKSSYTLFINSVAYPQDNIESFIKQTAIKRKELLLEIANTEGYDELYNKAKSQIAEIESASLRNEMLIQGYDLAIKEKELLTEKLPDLTTRFIDVTKELSTIRERVALAKQAEDYISKVRRQMEQNVIKMESMQTSIFNHKKSIENKQARIAELNSNSNQVAEDAQKRLGIVRSTLQRLQNAKTSDYEAHLRRQALISNKPIQNDYTGVLQRLESQLLEITVSSDPYCPDLGKNCPKFEKEVKGKTAFLEEQIADIKGRMVKYEIDNKAYEAALLAIPLPILTEEDLKQILELETEASNLSVFENYSARQEEKALGIEYLIKEIQELEMTIALLENDATNLGSDNHALAGELDTLKVDDPTELEDTLDKLKSEYFELEQKIKIAEKAAKDISIIMTEKISLMAKEVTATQKRESLELIKEAFGSTGIKTIIIDYLIPRLEYRINEILSKMSDFKIRLETQKTKFDGEGMSEGLFINIYNEQGEVFSLNNYSGGQKLKVNVAIAEALATMQKSAFRIFDEVFVGLDTESIEGFNEVIHNLQDKFSQVLCISHLQTIQDSFDEKLSVVKEGDTSKVVRPE